MSQVKTAVRPAPPALELLASFTALALWTAILIREWPRLTAPGPICGEPHMSLLDHCPLCYPAAAATLAAMALIIRRARRA
jgi:hypothetical protein